MQEETGSTSLLHLLRELKGKPGAALVYKPSEEKIIMVEIPCNDQVLECAPASDRIKTAEHLLEMLNTIVEAAKTTTNPVSVSIGTLEGISENLMRIRNLIGSSYRTYELDTGNSEGKDKPEE